MWELDHKEGWAPKNWCFRTVVLEKTLESPLDYKEIKPVNPKEINPEYSLEGLMLKLHSILWPPDETSHLIGKDPDAGKDWRQEEKGMTEDEGVRWHNPLNRHEFKQALGSLECYNPGVTKSRTQLRDWTGLKILLNFLGNNHLSFVTKMIKYLQ